MPEGEPLPRPGLQPRPAAAPRSCGWAPRARGASSRSPGTTATSLIADAPPRDRDQHGGEAILPWWDAGTQGLIQMSSLDRRFFARLGASRCTGSLCGATAPAGTASTNGSANTAPTRMSVRHARLVLLWGTNTKLTNRHLWPFIEEARATGAKVVVIDPLRTATAEAADWFVQPLPGTDDALMLAMMHVLVRDDLIDHDYVDRHAVGYDDARRARGRVDTRAGGRHLRPRRRGDRAAWPTPTAPRGRPSSAPSSGPSTTSTARCSSARWPACRCSPAPGATSAEACARSVGGWFGDATSTTRCSSEHLADGRPRSDQHEPPRPGAHRRSTIRRCRRSSCGTATPP